MDLLPRDRRKYRLIRAIAQAMRRWKVRAIARRMAFLKRVKRR